MNKRASLAAPISVLSEEEILARSRKVAELKRKVQSGTYLIRQYDIIEGLLDAWAKNQD
ncbi:flagellar biosynthesis anti-sigma factor FlgM [Desulfovibrio sulfodismutans]|uniref:Flagellar biosynthesis anti-sigma factor FlgM n=1 Tax=Desulfolutivibrio sulfodismutans TaxID=63561 RepID=A0A7K3NHK9_9BACT|nr:flagellar biosynthesis anti-sigma factor FlgM [Desulfolutivibrio sulfodismutans]NDY55672.1 flagellar biosynthesis anti-sigma factor FlgM [Desulfolutivibrio sulfodismutans]QLA13698.1 flagellar biosynthesis anti-sigma factor FlgM [Desulfolutivibrio sulfodismutans DSM 3696]